MNGFTAFHGQDIASDRNCALAVNEYGTERAWGLYLKNGTPKLIIQAPHPIYDENSERIALEIWRRTPNSLLIVAGAHRQAGGPGGTGSSQGLADPPWNVGSMFHKVTEHFMPLPQLQVHGFNNSTAPNHDVVLSSGSAPARQPLIRLADAIEATGLRVARVWEGFDELTAIGNRQSILAKNAGTAFMHMETNRTLRMSQSMTQTLISAVCSVL